MEKLQIKECKISNVLKFFKEISAIPRKSGEEKRISEYLINFAKERNLEYYTDEYYNVIIRKKVNENEEYLGLQAHTDMICEKLPNIEHDFSRDGIELYQDGDFIKANGTTLGADDGIGMAFILAILDSDQREQNIEGIFTVQEETTMIGAIKIDVSKIKTKKIIGLDNGRDDKMIISSANCLEWFDLLDAKKENVEEDLNQYELSYSNFKGGHSGGNIADTKRGNPIKLGMDILKEIKNVRIQNICGGSRVNVIPRDFYVRFFSSIEVEKIVNNKIIEQRDFYGDEVKIQLKKCDNKEKKAYTVEDTEKIIKYVSNFRNGALNFDENENSILSANFGAIKEVENGVQFECSIRSNNMKLRDLYVEDIVELEKEIGTKRVWKQELKGFEADSKNELANKCAEIYEELFNKPIDKTVVQGVIEGGFFKDRIPDLDYICIGAQNIDAHSPNERVSIKSIEKIWDFLNEILTKLAIK